MSAIPKAKIDVDEYLANEEKAPFKSEYYFGELFAMAGASPRHNLIAANIIGALRSKLRGNQCRPYTSDQLVELTKSAFYSYPDVVVICGEPNRTGRSNAISNPTVVFEVLSESTESYDRGLKSSSYRQIPSLKEIVLVDQQRAAVEVHTRQPNDEWVLAETTDLTANVRFKSLVVEVPMAEIYAGVEFGAQSTPPLIAIENGFPTAYIFRSQILPPVFCTHFGMSAASRSR